MQLTFTRFSLRRLCGLALSLFVILLGGIPASAQHCFPGFHRSISGHTVSFTNQSTADGSITGYTWDFGDGQTSTEAHPSHTYAAPGTYNVCVTMTAVNPDCSSSYCHHVVIAVPQTSCHAAFTAHQPDPAVTAMAFTDQSTSNSGIGTWHWDFGDGSTSTASNPVHTYATPGTYLICLTITSADGSCSNHVCHHVVVHHPPAADCHASYTGHPDSTEFTLAFTNTSTGTSSSTIYTWQFGDGATSHDLNPTHTYAHSGHYTVCLFIEDSSTNCSSHSCHTINVHHGGHHPGHPGHPGHPAKAGKNQTQDKNASETPLELWKVYPNPTTNQLVLMYELSTQSVVSVEIYDAAGARVFVSETNEEAKGIQRRTLATDNLRSGVYVANVIINGISSTYRFIVQH